MSEEEKKNLTQPEEVKADVDDDQLIEFSAAKTKKKKKKKKKAGKYNAHAPPDALVIRAISDIRC